MAILDLDVGSAANANDGATLRDAFINVRKMMYEIYGVSTNASDVLDSYTDTLDLATGSQTFKESVQDIVGAMFSGNTETNITATYEDSDGTIDLAVSADLDSIGAGDGLTGTSLTSGDPVLNVVGGDGITSSADEIEVTVDDSTIELSATNGSGAVRIKDLGVTTAKLAADAVTPAKISILDDSLAATDAHIMVGDGTDFGNVAVSGDVAISNTGAVTIQSGAVENSMLADNAVDHDELANRYTEDVDITTLTGAATFDCSTGSVFKLSGDITGTYTITLSNHKKGQIITIYPIKGNQTVNLSTASGTPTFNKIGGIDYEDNGSDSNILQIECVDDASNSVFFYSLATFAADKDDI
jgi:hypothetical protein